MPKNTSFISNFFTITKPFFASEKKWKATAFLLAISASLITATTLNVKLVTTQGSWMNELVGKNSGPFLKYILLYLIILALYVPINVFTSYLKDRLGILWRDWLTKSLLDKYLANHAYYTIELRREIDNPDQRIAEDVKLFTTNTTDIFVDILTATYQLISFSTLLWIVSPTLFFIAFFVSFLSTILSIFFFGVRLSDLNFRQNKLEASLRFNLARFRDNIESIAFYNGETAEKITITQRFVDAIQNSIGVIKVGAQYGVFFIGINMMANLVPVVYLAPSFFSGAILIGTITKSQAAFGSVKNAFNVVIKSLKQFSQLSAYTNRIYDLNYSTSNGDVADNIIQVMQSDNIQVHNVNLITFDGSEKLIENLNFQLSRQDRLLITGPSGCGKTSILRMLAGLWNEGTGDVTIPGKSKTFFISQKPYMVICSLRDQLLYPNLQLPEEELIRALKEVNLENLSIRVGGLDNSIDFSTVLSIGEQQRISFARLLIAKPEYAFLDEATSALDEANEDLMYSLLIENNIQYVSVGHHKSLLKYHNKILNYNAERTFELKSNTMSI